jgi:hypothetical protein
VKGKTGIVIVVVLAVAIGAGLLFFASRAMAQETSPDGVPDPGPTGEAED